MDFRERRNLKVGSKVSILMQQDVKNGGLTVGVVQEILSQESFHLKGIEVKLKTGQVGRVRAIKL